VKTSCSVLTLCTVLASAQALAVQPAKIEVGIFDVVPFLTVDSKYDDNITQTLDEDKIHSLVTVLAPSVEAVADNGEQRYTLGYAFSGGSYASSHADDFADNRFNAGFDWAFNHRNKLALSAEYFDGHEDRGTNEFSDGATGPDELTEQTLSATYTFGAESSKGRLIAHLENFDREYSNNRLLTQLRDYEKVEAGATFLWRVGGKTDLLIEATKADFDYLNDIAPIAGGLDTLDSELTKYLVGVTWEATAKTSGTIKVGHVKKTFDDADRKQASNTNWDVNVEWAPKTYSIITLTSAARTDESSGSGSYIDAEDYGISWGHSWSQKISSNAYYNISDETYVDDFAGRQDDMTRYGVRVDYEMRRWLSVGLSAGYSERDSNDASNNYERNITALHFQLSM